MQYQKTILFRTSCIFLAILIVGWLAYVLFGHIFIRAVYEGKIVFLENVLESRNANPLSFYLKKADQMVVDKSFNLVGYLSFLNLIGYFVYAKRIKRALAMVLLIAAIGEAYAWTALKIPAIRQALPEAFILPVRLLYRKQMHTIQYDPDCAQYDEELAYTLRPGQCVFKNEEFETTYEINSLGLRDDERSLVSPEVIMLGDSYTMGWGVAEEQTFASLVEKEGGRETLNAGVSSYGTVRQMLLLKRLEFGRMKYLVIQYCPNDDKENQIYKENTNHLPIMSSDAYKRIQQQEISKQRYFPGRYVSSIALIAYDELKKSIRHLFFGREFDPFSAISLNADSVAYFLNAIAHAAPEELLKSRDSRILVLADAPFCGYLDTALASGPYPLDESRVACLDVATDLNASSVFRLDPHWTPKRHREIARKILDWMASQKGRAD